MSGLPGNKTEVGSTSQPQKTKETLSIPIKKVALLSLGLGCVEAVVDSGSEMTVCHPDVVPPELIAEAEASGEWGSVLLRSAFGEEFTAKTYHVPCRLLKNCDKTVCTPDVLLYCAITPQLTVDKVLLSAEDYTTLEQSRGGVIVPPAVPPGKLGSHFGKTSTSVCVPEEDGLGDALLDMFEESELRLNLSSTSIGRDEFKQKC